MYIMKLGPLNYTWQNVLRGVLIYSIGDTIAAIILGQFMIDRMLGIMFVGGTVYALEIPNYFRWIDHVVPQDGGLAGVVKRTALAMLYFNPLWIARHMFFILLFSLRLPEVDWQLFVTASWSFLVNIPISFAGNYVIQNKIPLDWRFFASAVFSSLLAIYYAVSLVVF